MKRATLTFGICFITMLSTAQNWAPIGAKWTYGTIGYFGEKYTEWTSIKDTIMGNDTCKIIQRIGFPITYDYSPGRLITKENNNIIYYYNTQINQFTVLYDFNKNAGESWIMKVDSCDLLITVDSTGTTNINGDNLKTLYISCPSITQFQGTVLQHIGHLSKPFPFIYDYCFGGLTCGGSFHNGLRCYEDSIFGIYSFNIAPTCDYIIDGIAKNYFSLKITIYPNPLSDFLTIETTFSKKENISISLYNVIGTNLINIEKEIVVGTYNKQLYIESLPAGVYFLSIQTDNTNAIKKVVKH